MRKKNKFINNTRKDLPAAVYDLSIILIEDYEKLVKLTGNDQAISTALEDLLEDKITVKTYINKVQHFIESEGIE